MSDLEKGAFVWHKKMPEWGPGVVASIDTADKVTILFERAGKKLISQKVAGSALEELEPEDVTPGSLILDESRWKDVERVEQAQASLTTMIAEFTQFYSEGFRTESFDREERDYKFEAAKKARELLDPGDIQELVAQGQFSEVHSRACKAVGKTNTVFPMEKMRLKDIPSALHEDFAGKLLALLQAGDDFPEKMESLARLLQPHGAAKWPTLTFLASISDPASRVFVKPHAVSEAARALSFDIEYETLPNATTYRRIEILYKEVGDALAEAGFPPRDAIDTMTFLWFGCGLGRQSAFKEPSM